MNWINWKLWKSNYIWTQVRTHPKFCKPWDVPLALQKGSFRQVGSSRCHWESQIFWLVSTYCTYHQVRWNHKNLRRLQADHKQNSQDRFYPLPKTDKLLNALTGGRAFTKLDLSRVYRQLVLDEASKPYTIISTHRGTIVCNLVCQPLLPSFRES